MNNLSIEQAIEILKKSENKEDCLRKAYNILTKRFYGSRLKTITKIHYLFFSDLEKMWQKGGFLHCTKHNQLLKMLLLKSGFFKKEDIKLKWTTTWIISPHQYSRIRINDHKYINIDIWGYNRGIKFGDYAHGLY